jgi:hypothetical protein
MRLAGRVRKRGARRRNLHGAAVIGHARLIHSPHVQSIGRCQASVRGFGTVALFFACACGSSRSAGTGSSSGSNAPSAGASSGESNASGVASGFAPSGTGASSGQPSISGATSVSGTPSSSGATAASGATAGAESDSSVGSGSDASTGAVAEAAAPDAPLEASIPDAGLAGDVVGKVTVGYQGWFAAVGDGSPVNLWWHYDNNTQNAPSPSDEQLKGWPYMVDFTTGFQSGFANLGNGKPATLFSSYTYQTVDAHFSWMQAVGIDTAALQRFNDETPTRNAVALNVMRAAEAHDVKFYVMYDISGWTTFQTDLKSDWMNVITGTLRLTSSSAYAHQDGKPVVCIWGMGFSDRPGDPASSMDVIDFFKAQGLYVIGGVPLDWRTQGGGSKAAYGPVYDDFDMISPWMVGVIGDVAGSDSIRQSNNVPDEAYCQSHGIDYQPCVLPGDLSLHQRVHGDFMWHQFANMIQIGAQGLYVSMFDEFGEGNQIAKTAENASEQPTNGAFVPLDEDGTACSADYYLRLTGDADKMLKGQIPFTLTRPTPPM